MRQHARQAQVSQQYDTPKNVHRQSVMYGIVDLKNTRCIWIMNDEHK